MRKIHQLGLTARQILRIVQQTNLRLAARVLGVSDVGLRKWLIRENLYFAARIRRVRRANRKETLQAYQPTPQPEAPCTSGS